MNTTQIIGYLTKDPIFKITKDGSAICEFTLAFNHKKDKVSFYNVVAWRINAEICRDYLVKGKEVFICGVMEQKSIRDNEDNKLYDKWILTASLIKPIEKINYRNYYNRTDLNSEGMVF